MKLNSLYWHFPYCKHLCNYCDFFKKKSDGRNFSELEDFYTHSWEEHKKLMQKHSMEWGEIETFYIGGGTPSLWSDSGIKFLKQKILPNFKLSDNFEFTIEIDPATWNEEEYLKWKSIGVNRYSVGLQSLDKDFLKIADRAHSLEDSINTLEILNKHNENFSCDFLLSLPCSENKRDIIAELKLMLEYNPKHVSLYLLTVPGHYVHFDELPDDTYSQEEYLKVSAFLRKNGFSHYEVSNFCLKGFHSRNNYVYWEGKSFGAIGPSATGYFSTGSESAYRFKWKTSTVGFSEEHLTIKELRLEQLYIGLRSDIGLKLSNYPEVVVDKFKQWCDREVASIEKGVIKLRPSGFIILDSLVDEIFGLKAI